MKKALIIILVLAVSYVLLKGISILRLSRKESKPFVRNLPPFTLSGHRGASVEAAPNTMPAFRICHALDPQAMLECDVRSSKDGVVMISHDAELERCTDGQGVISKHDYADLRKLDAGYNVSFDDGVTYPFRGKGQRLATLEELLQEFPAARVSIDIKEHDVHFAEKVLELLRRYNALHRVAVGSFSSDIVDYVRAQEPEVCIIMGMRENILFLLLQKMGLSGLYKPFADIIMVSEFTKTDYPEDLHGARSQGVRIITPDYLAAAHAWGIPVFAWTINDPRNMQRLYGWGIDGIITDNPRLLQQVVNRRNTD